MLTRAQAQAYIESHGHDFAEFVAEVGDRNAYMAQGVRAWLGY